jgi:hypothetical protein
MQNRDVEHGTDDDGEENGARQPWAGIDLTQTPTVQMGMFLLLVLLALIVLWITWSPITAG